MTPPVSPSGSSLTLDEGEQTLNPFATEESRTTSAFGPMPPEDEEKLYSPWQPIPSYEDESLPPGAWKGEGTPEQVAFREKVLTEHIRRSRGRHRPPRPPRPDLAPSQRRRVAGTQVEMATTAAAAAGKLLEAANQALVAARASANPDALNTIRIAASSGYRGQAHQASSGGLASLHSGAGIARCPCRR